MIALLRREVDDSFEQTTSLFNRRSEENYIVRIQQIKKFMADTFGDICLHPCVFRDSPASIQKSQEIVQSPTEDLSRVARSLKESPIKLLLPGGVSNTDDDTGKNNDSGEEQGTRHGAAL